MRRGARVVSGHHTTGGGDTLLRLCSTALLLGSLGLAGCAGAPPPPERPRPIAYADTLPIAEPGEREPNEITRLIRVALSGEVSDVLSPRRWLGPEHEALDVDRFDDVVNSAWYERRNRAGSLSPSDVRRGPTTSGGPADGPLTIVDAKIAGISPGFTIEDGAGARYILKFDPKGFHYLSSSAGVIANRLLHAAGYHVPEDYMFHFTFDRLRVEEDAVYEDAGGVERPLTLAIARDALSRTDTLPDGRYVAVASKFVPGSPKGPFLFQGTRVDDPNDWYPHEHRRDLRGLRVVSSWVNHVDMRFMNTLDVYVSPGYLRHYLIDFAASLGSGTIRPHDPREGLEYNVDFWDSLGRLVTLGFHRAGWEEVEWEPLHPTIGWLRGEGFQPEQWKPNWPNPAFNNMTVRDAYWGAKLVGSFTDEQIRAAVGAGELPDAWAADTLATILEIRRDAIVRHWYGKVSPVEAPRLTDDDGLVAVAFVDIGLRDGPWTAAGTRYEWAFADPSLGIRRRGTAPIGPRGDEVLVIVEKDDRSGGITDGGGRVATLDIRVVREGAGVEPRPARLYLRHTGGGYEVAGLEH